jgi:hypothetical protein
VLQPKLAVAVSERDRKPTCMYSINIHPKGGVSKRRMKSADKIQKNLLRMSMSFSPLLDVKFCIF